MERTSPPYSEPSTSRVGPANEDKHPQVTLADWSTRTRAVGHGTAADGQTEKTHDIHSHQESGPRHSAR